MGSNRIKLSDEIREGLKTAKDARVLEDSTPPSGRLARIERLPDAIDAINAIATSLPDPYHWRFVTAEAFSQQFRADAQAGASVEQLNGYYWRDTLSTIEAHTVMSVWRMMDIAQACLSCVGEDAVVPASILARSALESAIQFVHDARTMTATLTPVLDLDLTKSLVSSTELENLILMTVYATRRTGSEEIYKSRNILTVIDKIAKVAKDDPLKDEYEILCELTHPNFLGRSVYLTGREEKRLGDEIRTVSHENGLNTAAITQSTLWALSWAIEGQVASTHLIQNVIRDFFSKFPCLSSVRA